MQFPASEAKSEANPYAPQAAQLAGDTQNMVKEGLKDLENWGKEKAKELLGGQKK
ncbi:hypothetical protein CPB86DRAFT_778204 [Serendipita vermifera]|nr:hypothetical protein CPB86DRAFT_778204 [Serendipita vermifera]